VALSANRGLDVQVPGLVFWRGQVGRILARVRRTVLPAHGGRGHGDQKQHCAQAGQPSPAPPCALPNYKCVNSRHESTHIPGNGPKSKTPLGAQTPQGRSLKPRFCQPGSLNLLVRALAPHNVVSRICDSHFKQSLRPAMPAPPVGSSPSFRAVAFVCVVTSPNEVEPFSRSACRNLPWQSAALSLIKARRFACQEKSATRKKSVPFPHDPLDAAQQHFLVTGIVPNRLFVPQAVVIHAPLAEHPRPGHRPSVIPDARAFLLGVH
jgi:hypothetical protein